jgi:hypothetical protein
MYFTLATPSFLVQEDVNFLLTSQGGKMAFSWFSIGLQLHVVLDFVLTM